MTVTVAPPAQPLLNVRQTAAYFGVHENTIRNWVKKGILQPVRLPGSGYKRFPKVQVEQMAKEMRTAQAPMVQAPLHRVSTVRPIDPDTWQ